MRVFLFIDWFLYYTVEFANALSNEAEVMLVTRDHDYKIAPGPRKADVGEFLDDCLDPKVRREMLRFRQRSLKNIFEVIRIYRKVRAFRPQIIHVQENSDWRIAIVARLAIS